MKTTLLSTVAILAVAATVASTTRPVAADADDKKTTNANNVPTRTKIKHLVVIFDENRAFDHYFGTYPNVIAFAGEPRFVAAKNTPHVNNLLSSPGLIDDNPNTLNAANATAATANPFRLDRTQADSRSQSHNYTGEQKAYDSGANDLFPNAVGRGGPGGSPTNDPTVNPNSAFATASQVMGYYDGETVTALWNYAQNFAMSDNAYTDTYGPSTPGLLNMWAGQTNGAVFTVGNGATFFGGGAVPPAGTPAFNAAISAKGDAVFNPVDGSYTLIQDVDPTNDICSGPATNLTVNMTSKNIGDLLNAAKVPWGSFVGGFDLTKQNINGSTGCQIPGVATGPGSTGRSSLSEVTGRTVNDYIQHHMWFQYYSSTANKNHTPPKSIKEIGHDGPANHAYDLGLFKAAVASGNYPAVSFIKQSAFQDGHPGNSNALDEQNGLIELVNFLQQQPDWDSTAIIFTYDDSDGQYDHVAPAAFLANTAPGLVHTSFDATNDAAYGTGNCGVPGASGALGAAAPKGLSGNPVNGRCGPGFRIPFLVISPFAKKNFVSHTPITQASVTQFIEHNWLNDQRLGGGSFDTTTGSILDMFDFSQKTRTVLLNDDGTVLEASKGKNKKNKDKDD